MTRVDRLIGCVRHFVLPGAALGLFALAAIKVWPFADLAPGVLTAAQSLYGLMCVLAPSTAHDLTLLRGQGHSSFTAADSRSLQDDDVIMILGVLILVDANAGFLRALICRGW